MKGGVTALPYGMIGYAGPGRWFPSLEPTTAMMMQRLFLLAVPACLACSQPADRAPDSSHATVASTSAGTVVSSVHGTLPPNRMGRIPILEVHVVRDTAGGEFIIARSTFQHALQA